MAGKTTEDAGSVLGLNLSARQEIVVLEKDEYELQILRVMPQDIGPEGEAKKARLQIICEAVGEPTADDIFHTVWWPNEEDTAKQRNRKMQDIADFMIHLGLDTDVTEINLEEWVGLKFTAILDVKEYEGRKSNVIKKITGGA